MKNHFLFYTPIKFIIAQKIAAAGGPKIKYLDIVYAFSYLSKVFAIGIQATIGNPKF